MRPSLELSAGADDARASLEDALEAERTIDARRISETIGTIVHELKTPLASMLGYSRMLRSGWASLEQGQRDEFFEVIDQQGRRLQRLVEDLLDWARTDATPSALAREPVDLSRVIERAVTTVRGMAGDRELTASVPPQDLNLYGDATAIEHVLTNLLENAIKYSPDGTRVCVDVEEHLTEIRISVSDEGPGIDREDLPHVFERFRRGATSAHGFGLGLHIVASLVAAHKGRVWVRSELGRGATFVVALPRRARRDGARSSG